MNVHAHAQKRDKDNSTGPLSLPWMGQSLLDLDLDLDLGVRPTNESEEIRARSHTHTNSTLHTNTNMDVHVHLRHREDQNKIFQQLRSPSSSSSSSFPSFPSVDEYLASLQSDAQREKFKNRMLHQMESDDQFCRFWTDQETAAILDLDPEQTRQRIVRLACDPSVSGSYAFSSPNFVVQELTKERVILLYALIDACFFHQTLYSFISRRTCGLFDFNLEDHIQDEEDTVAFFECTLNKSDWEALKAHTKGNGSYTCPVLKKPNKFIGIRVHKSMWLDTSKNRNVDGLKNHDNKLYALVATLCHEFTHVLNFFRCADHEHTKEFRMMNASLYGHSKHSHTSEDKPLLKYQRNQQDSICCSKHRSH